MSTDIVLIFQTKEKIMCCNNRCGCNNNWNNGCNCNNNCGCRCSNPFVICRGCYQRTFVNTSSFTTNANEENIF